MPKSRFTGLAIAGVGVLLLTASLREVAAELSPYIAGGVSAEQRFLSLESGGFAPANSLWSKNLFFIDCVNASTDPFVLLDRTVQSRRRALQYCLDQSNTVLAAEPAYAMAWLAKSVALGELGMFDAMQSALVETWRTAPNLQWMAEQRMQLVDRHSAEATRPEVLANYQSDVRAMLDTPEGIAAVAKLYFDRPERRELITAGVETARIDLQQTFLKQVRTLASGGS